MLSVPNDVEKPSYAEKWIKKIFFYKKISNRNDGKYAIYTDEAVKH